MRENRRFFLMALGAAAQPPGLYEEDPLASRGIREKQYREWEAYAASLPAKLDTSSAAAYERSVRAVRDGYARWIGYPPPKLRAQPLMRLEKAGEDEQAIWNRAFIEVGEGLETYGLYVTPKREGKLPLLIAQHGGGGFPEMAAFRGGANYRDLVRGPVRDGCIVFAPLLLQYPFVDRNHNTPIPPDARQRVAETLRDRGTTIEAVESAKVSRALDAILTRPEVDAERVGMAGLSFGGSHTVLQAALDERIRVAVVSGAPNIELLHLVAPRAVHVQYGAKDTILGNLGRRGQEAAKRFGALWGRLGVAARWESIVFDGGHDFRWDLAREFVQRHLKR